MLQKIFEILAPLMIILLILALAGAAGWIAVLFMGETSGPPTLQPAHESCECPTERPHAYVDLPYVRT